MSANVGSVREARSNRAQNQVLQTAVKCNKLTFVKLLHKNGTDLNSVDNRGKTSLMWASKLGHDDIVKYLLEAGVHLDTTDHCGLTALHEATIAGNASTARLLGDAGANLEAKTKGGQTAIHYSAKNSLTLTKYFLNNHVDPLDRDNNGFTPLHWAVSAKENNIENIKLIMGRCLHANKYLIKELIFTASSTGNIEAVKLLEEKGADLTDKSDDKGMTVLHQAAFFDNSLLVRYLLQRNISVDIRDVDGWTPLHVASARGCLDTVILLVSSGADINSKTNMGSTPLKLAILNKRKPEIEFLLFHKADVNALDNKGQTILDVAIANEDQDTALYLRATADFSSVPNKPDLQDVQAADETLLKQNPTLHNLSNIKNRQHEIYKSSMKYKKAECLENSH